MPKAPNKIKRPWKIERKSFERVKSNNAIYNSWKWRKFAKRYKEKNPLCIKCEQEGIITSAYVADHIKRIEDGGAVFNNDNIQSLCVYHHNQKSGKEAHGYKEEGGMG